VSLSEKSPFGRDAEESAVVAEPVVVRRESREFLRRVGGAMARATTRARAEIDGRLCLSGSLAVKRERCKRLGEDMRVRVAREVRAGYSHCTRTTRFWFALAEPAGCQSEAQAIVLRG